MKAVAVTRADSVDISLVVNGKAVATLSEKEAAELAASILHAVSLPELGRLEKRLRKERASDAAG